MKTFAIGLLLMGVSVLSGCASGPKFTEVKSSIPVVAADQGRVYFYRSNSLVGSAIQPDIFLNGDKVGSSVPGGFFFVDRVPGDYQVSTTTEVEKQVTFTLEKGQQRYIKTTISFGVIAGRVQPELVDPATAEQEIVESSYIGTVQLKK